MTGRRGGAGFTLLEILIAIGILAIGLVTIFSLFPIGIYAVKDTVESSRAASLAKTARAELAARRADIALTSHNSANYGVSPTTYVPFGPWEKPWDVRIWREYLYEFVDSASVPHRRVLFDDRTMLPITLSGTFDGTDTVVVDTGSLTREADLLEHFYDPTLPGPNMYAPWEIRLRVRGAEFLIHDRTYNGTDLASITVDNPAGLMPTGTLPFEILLPVALKDPPIDVPLEWAGGLADFTGGPLMGDNGLGRGGWISVDGDWYQVDARNPAPIAQPKDFTLKNTYSYYPPPATDVPFRLVLPVVLFGSSLWNDNASPGPEDDTQTLPVAAGGGAQLGWLESGAFVEVVLDGGRGTFDPVNAPDRRTVYNLTNPTGVNWLNSDTKDFIAPGNFIRIGGRDYEIASTLQDLDVDSEIDDFRLVGTVPNLGPDVYFHIVLGYDATPGSDQLPGVARFPVRSVRRTPTVGSAPVGYPVTSFEVGRDANGNLPLDLWPAAAQDPFHNPVKVLPANRTTYTYTLSALPRSPAGEFDSTDTNVTGPNWPSSPETDAVAPVPFPSVLNPADPSLGGNTGVYELRALSEAGIFHCDNIVGNAGDYTTLALPAPPPFANPAVTVPFHAYDRNDFDEDLTVGDGTYTTVAAGVGRVDLSTSDPNAIFVAVGSLVKLTGAFGSQSYTVTSVDTTLDGFEVDISGALPTPADGAVVTVTIPATAAGADNYPHGRGNFVTGSDAVRGIYQDTAGSFADVPGRSFPYAQVSGKRYHLQVGDYIHAPDGHWYAVKSVHDDPGVDFLVLDRPYEGASTDDFNFEYVSPIREAYDVQIAVHRNYRVRPLRDAAGDRDLAAAFGFDATGAVDPTRMYVHLQSPLPPDIKPGDYIRADGDASHPAGGPPFADPGVMENNLAGGDAIDGDRRWYMIDSVGPEGVAPTSPAYRTLITLTSPYRGYVPPAGTPEVFQPASVSSSVLRTYDTVIGAF